MSMPRLWKSHRDYALNGLSDAVITAVGFASSVLIARALGPEGRGQLAAALMWPTTVAALSTLGLPHAFAYAAGARWTSAGRLARFGTVFALVVGLPMALAYFLAAPYLLRVAFPESALSVRLFGCFIPLTLWAGLWMAIYQGTGDFVTWNMAKVLRSAGYTAWIATALLLGVASVPVVMWSRGLGGVSPALLGLNAQVPADDSPGAVPSQNCCATACPCMPRGSLHAEPAVGPASSPSAPARPGSTPPRRACRPSSWWHQTRPRGFLPPGPDRG